MSNRSSPNGSQGGSTTNGQSSRASVRGPPARRGITNLQTVAEDKEAYFHTEDWPFTADRHDVGDEDKLVVDEQELDRIRGVPRLMPYSYKQIDLSPSDPQSMSLDTWDIECAGKHLKAIAGSVVSHDDLHDFTLMDGEEAVNVVDLAGVVNAPGLYNDVAQECRMIFTNENRIVFTQAKHSAEVGVPRVGCLLAMLSCCHERWSRRKWSSFYASIQASEVLQVFVQQTLTTSYDAANCNCKDILSNICCAVGGTMNSEKDMNGATQTLGDYDQEGELTKRWHKTRFMRHALVIRYVDCATNAVSQTTAMARPDTSAAQLYQMARSIESNITLRSADWFKHKTLPTPLAAAAFQNSPPAPPLFMRKTYKWSMFVLLLVAVIFTFFVDAIAGFFMILSVMTSLGGSYANTTKVANKAAIAGLSKVTATTALTQGGSAGVYAISFLLAVANSRSSATA